VVGLAIVALEAFNNLYSSANHITKIKVIIRCAYWGDEKLIQNIGART
jgi:hypothetical protein